MPPNESADAGRITPSRRAFLSASAVTAAAAVPMITAGPAAAVPARLPGGPTLPGRPIRPQAPDRELRELLAEIDQHRIEVTVRRLAAFGTRHTLGEQPRQGYFAQAAPRPWPAGLHGLAPWMPRCPNAQL